MERSGRARWSLFVVGQWRFSLLSSIGGQMTLRPDESLLDTSPTLFRHFVSHADSGEILRFQSKYIVTNEHPLV